MMQRTINLLTPLILNVNYTDIEFHKSIPLLTSVFGKDYIDFTVSFNQRIDIPVQLIY
jgi:hypothetical protein